MKKKQKQKRFQKLRIISSNYKIKYFEKIEDEKGHLDGRIWESLKEIWVRSGMSYQRTLQVIMHESMHGVTWELCITGKTEDKNIQLTTGVTCFIRDNPEFIMEYMRVLNQ